MSEVYLQVQLVNCKKQSAMIFRIDYSLKSRWPLEVYQLFCKLFKSLNELHLQTKSYMLVSHIKPDFYCRAVENPEIQFEINFLQQSHILLKYFLRLWSEESR